LEPVARSPQGKGFQRLPHRWIVERTFGGLNRWRRLSKDFEHLTETSECTIRVVMIYLMVRRKNMTRLEDSNPPRQFEEFCRTGSLVVQRTVVWF